MNNFYYKRQKIFKSLLNNDNELIQDGQRASDYSSRKMKISNSQFDYSNQIGEQNENNLFEYLNRENKISRNCQTGISIINKIDENIMNNKKIESSIFYVWIIGKKKKISLKDFCLKINYN